jgi:predicted dehydrogenase
MQEQLGFGFIGAGEIAVASARAMSTSSYARLARVSDARLDLAADLAATYGGIPAGSVAEVLADPAVAAVYIATPHFLHRPLALQAAAAGKHVLIEKPMGLNPEEAQEIIDACRRAGVACGVPFVVRYAPAYREAYRLVHSGAIGQVTGFRIVYRGDKPRSYWDGGYSGRASSDWRQQYATAGGGVMIMNTIHDLDSLLWITGLNVEAVSGMLAHLDGPGDVEEVALATLQCAGGALASIEASSSLPGGQGPTQPWVNRIYGTGGQIVLPNPWGVDPVMLFTRDSGQWTSVDGAAGADTRQQAIDEFAAAVLAGVAVPIPGEACLAASTIIHGVYTSARSQSWIRIAPVRA